ncbi:response regulator [Bacillaceae bacterium IKA-2]|jgi:two-component system response regulator DctR|nr:response regulator [Bacillaceae bacterium IKA-2]
MNRKNKEEKFIRILLIEDDLMVQEVNRMFIEKVKGFKVVGIASNGMEGRQMIKELNPDIVLLDIFMPKEDGLKTISKLRQDQLDVDIIAVTAANDTATVKRLLRYGVVDYIVKPFTFERLKQALEQYKEMYDQLRLTEKFSQDKLDEVMQQKENSKPDGLPKGLQSMTLKQILDYLEKIDHSKSAEEIGSEVGLARVTVRRYLNYLESTKKVEMELTYGTIGRPIQLYRLITKEASK